MTLPPPQPYKLTHLSPSKLSAYDYCPAGFKQSYVDGTPIPPNVPMQFGLAVHSGLEALYLGGDPDTAFRQSWRAKREGLRSLDIPVADSLTFTGLTLIERVAALNLQGIPERKVLLRTDDYLGVPILGYADLVNVEAGYVVDWKTTGGQTKWTQERADKEIWQSAIYSMWFLGEYERIPDFEFVILNRDSGTVQRFHTKRTEVQFGDAMSRAREVVAAIKAEAFACKCRRHQEPAA